ncbi:MAG: Hydrogenase-4 component B [Lentisphaerae bacterium ADurb.BinA184]|nr:MAG: Hydrogenase-4 component B [Lentisphaerae bacterium ADurb.BinA184]
MILWLLILVPAVAGLVCLAGRGTAWRRGLQAAAAGGHAGLVGLAWTTSPAPACGGWLALDRPGLFFLSITSVLFLASTAYSLGYLRREVRHTRVRDFQEGFLFGNAPEGVFCGGLLLFLAAMTLVTVSHHFVLLWVGMEATTLASAPLIYFHRHHRSLEATWKYLLICSIGIGVALLGNLSLAVAGRWTQEARVPLVLDVLLRHADALNPAWVKAAFIFFLVGYGTKMGLAPMHTWLPDAHSEAPSPVSALLSGALLNCAFLGILRAHQVCVAAGLGGFSRELLLLFGLLSMGFAAFFVINQRDYKRLLAYSSVEHMGILAVGAGLGGAGTAGAMLHALNHSLCKGAAFLTAGTILSACQTRAVRDVRGLLRSLPLTGRTWLAVFIALAGLPPFGMFLSELLILKSALDRHAFLTAGLFLLFLAVVFIGMSRIMLRMAQGPPGPGTAPRTDAETPLTVIPVLVLLAAALLLGLWAPPALTRVLAEVASVAGGV